MIYNTLLEYVKATLYPNELKNKNIVYHSTDIDSFINILDSNELKGTVMYDWGISTSRNRDLAFGHNDFGDEYDNYHHNAGNVQVILDRNKIKDNYKIKAFDFEEIKRHGASMNNYTDSQQSEDKILTNKIKNIHKYIIGIQFIKNKYINKINDDYIQFKELVIKYGWVVYDAEWNNITHLFQDIV